jgi:SAM-dependent methyltransferase
MRGYEELFEERGNAYDRAMRRFPKARRNEFMQLLERAGPEPGMRVADVPAGGAYLARYLPEGCEWLGHEPCGDFTAHAGGDRRGHVPLLPLPWSEDYADMAVSLAGVHHLEDKRAFFAELSRVVKPEGRLALSDVAEGSAVARFLDDFIGAHNSTGHEGIYLTQNTVRDLEESGWRARSAESVDFHWVFADRRAMGEFCHALFDVRTIDAEEVADGIERILGVDPLPEGGIGMRWSLMTVVALNER